MVRTFRAFLFLFALSFCCQGFTIQPIIPCVLNHTNQRVGDVAICMMFQNEARYLKEWIEYHKTIGVTHFYLYNNASSDNYMLNLYPYVISGEVELFDVLKKTESKAQHNELQRAVYYHAVKCSKGIHKWLAIIDSDEFICMPHDDNISDFLEQYSYAGGVVVNWVMYGSSNIEELAPTDLQIDRFVYRAPNDWEENFSYKSIVRPRCVKTTGVHYCSYYPGMNAVFANHEEFSEIPKYNSPPIEEIRINHYWWRDEKYFREVKLPRKSGWMTNFTEKQIEERRQLYNSVYDSSMERFVEKTREKILQDIKE